MTRGEIRKIVDDAIAAERKRIANCVRFASHPASNVDGEDVTFSELADAIENYDLPLKDE